MIQHTQGSWVVVITLVAREKGVKLPVRENSISNFASATLLPQGLHRWRGSKATLWDFSLERVTGTLLDGCGGVLWWRVERCVLPVFLRNLSGKLYKDFIGEYFCSSELQSWPEINWLCAAIENIQAQVKILKNQMENGLISKLKSPIPSETPRHRGETVEVTCR